MNRNELKFEIPGMRGVPLLRFPSGAIQQGCLVKATEIDGVRFHHQIAFYESGKLRAGRARDWVAPNGIKADNWVYFDESGRLKSVLLSQDETIHSLRLGQGQFADLYESAKLKGGYLTEERAFVRLTEGGTASRVEA